MEEIYTLLQERIENVDEVKKKSVNLEPASSIPNIEKEIKESEITELTQSINHVKRLEKFRIIKENELLEVIFGLKSFDSSQKLKFQAKSYEIMKNIKQDFNYEKYKYTGETKDIAKLYLNFFITLRLDGKINDLKKAYANNKFMGYPIISALLKWLVEIARKYFQNVLEEKNKDILNWALMKKKKAAALNANQKLTQSTVLTRPQSNTKPRMQSHSRILTDQSKNRVSPDNTKDEIEIDKYMVPGNSSTTNEMLISGSPKNSECKSALIPKSSKAVVKEQIKYGRSQTNPKEVAGNIDPSPVTDQTQVHINPVNLKDGKFLRRGPELYKQHKNIVHILVPANHTNNYLDVIDDLDLYQTNIMIPQLSSVQKSIKKRESNLVTIDLEKKKELVNLVYRTLYYRNLDIDTRIANFQTRLVNHEKVEYEPLGKVRKGEYFCENYTINFQKRFPHVVCNSNNSRNHQHASKHHRVKLSKGRNPFAISPTLGNQSHDAVLNDSPTLPVCPLSPKNVKPMSSKASSKKDTDSPLLASKGHSIGGNLVLNDTQEHIQNSSQRVNQDSFSESPLKSYDTEEYNYKKKGSPGMGFGYRSEHHFRIKKRVSVLHDTKLDNERNFKSMMSKPTKLENPITWGNSESKVDNPSERTNLTQTTTSRREMSNGFSKNHPEQETFSRQKVMRSSIANQKMRLWSNEKLKHPSTLDDIGAKSIVHVKSSYNQLEEAPSHQSKEELPPTEEEDAINIKAVYKSQLVSPKNDGVLSNMDSIDYTKMNCHPSFQENSAEVSDTTDQIENLKAKNSCSTKPLKIILKLYPKHHKYYSEPFNIPQRETS